MSRVRISFPAPSSKLDIFAKRQVVTCLFCLPVGFSSFPKSSAILFGSIPDDPLFVFLILLYYLLFIFTKKMTAFSLPRETSLHRNRDASLLSAIPSLRSLRISFPAPSSKLDIFAKRQVVTCLFCLPVGFSSFPKSSAFLRERSGRSAFREHSRQTPFQGIFLFYQQLLPETYSFPLVSSLFCRTVIRFLSAFARLLKSNRLKIKTRLLPRFLRAFLITSFSCLRAG